MNIGDRAAQRFGQLRAASADSYRHAVRTGWSPPTGYCVSAVARMITQPDAAELVRRVAAIQDRLVDEMSLVAYPESALHISLLGCTQREPGPWSFPTERRARLTGALGSSLRGVPRCRMHLGSLNVTGLQAFIEVLPVDESWADARLAVEHSMVDLDERPLAYTDREPVHLNIGWFAATDSAERITPLVNGDLGVGLDLDIGVVEAVVTDFPLSSQTLEVLARFDLG